MDTFGSWTEPPLVVAVLRQPADRIYSSFRYTQGNLAAIDRRLIFSKYVKALLAGRPEDISQYYRSEVRRWIGLRDLEWSRYVEWLGQWESAVGGERLIVLLSEDLRVRPDQMLKSLCRRAALDPGFYDDFKFDVRNESVRPRSQDIHRLARRWGSRLPGSRAKAALKRVYERVQVNPRKTLLTEEDKDALRRLDEYFQPWNDLLAQRFGLDLRTWQVSR